MTYHQLFKLSRRAFATILAVLQTGFFGSVATAEAGLLQSMTPSSTRPTVFLVHDVHANLEAQNSIADLVDSLRRKASLGFIGLEGSSSPIDISWMRNWDNTIAVHAAADYLLKTNLMSGPVHAAVVLEAPLPPLYGVDEPALYQANIDAYRAAAPIQEQTLSNLSRAEENLNARLSNNLSPKTMRLYTAIQSRRDGTSQLDKHLDVIKQFDVTLPKNLQAYTTIQESSHKYTPSQIQQEKSLLTASLSRRLPARERGQLQKLSADAARGDLATFHQRLSNLCLMSGVSLDDYPAIREQAKAAEASNIIDITQLESDLENVDNQALAKTATEGEMALIREADYLKLTQKLASFSLSHNEWEKYTEFKSEQTALIPNAAVFEEFYKVAVARDEALAQNTANLVEATGRSGILVAGGFHAQGVTTLLRDAGIAVKPIFPSFDANEVESGSDYLKRFLSPSFTQAERVPTVIPNALALPPLADPIVARATTALAEVATRGSTNLGRLDIKNLRVINRQEEGTTVTLVVAIQFPDDSELQATASLTKGEAGDITFSALNVDRSDSDSSTSTIAQQVRDAFISGTKAAARTDGPLVKLLRNGAIVTSVLAAFISGCATASKDYVTGRSPVELVSESHVQVPNQYATQVQSTRKIGSYGEDFGAEAIKNVQEAMNHNFDIQIAAQEVPVGEAGVSLTKHTILSAFQVGFTGSKDISADTVAKTRETTRRSGSSTQDIVTLVGQGPNGVLASQSSRFYERATTEGEIDYGNAGLDLSESLRLDLNFNLGDPQKRKAAKEELKGKLLEFDYTRELVASLVLKADMVLRAQQGVEDIEQTYLDYLDSYLATYDVLDQEKVVKRTDLIRAQQRHKNQELITSNANAGLTLASHSLVTLKGSTSNGLYRASDPLPELPALPDVGTPVDLLNNARIIGILSTLGEQNIYEIRQAVREQYNFNLSFVFQNGVFNFSALTDILMSAVKQSHHKAKIKVAEARYEQTRQELLKAFVDLSSRAEFNLSEIQRLSTDIQDLKEQADLYRNEIASLEVESKYGFDKKNSLDQLSLAHDNLKETEISILYARSAQLQHYIDLMFILGIPALSEDVYTDPAATESALDRSLRPITQSEIQEQRRPSLPSFAYDPTAQTRAIPAPSVTTTGGSWLTNTSYIGRAWLETPVVYLLATALYFGVSFVSPELAYTPGLILASLASAPAIFWAGHIPLNSNALFTGPVVKLTLAKLGLSTVTAAALIAIPAASPATLALSVLGVIGITTWHRTFQIKAITQIQAAKNLLALSEDKSPEAVQTAKEALNNALAKDNDSGATFTSEAVKNIAQLALLGASPSSLFAAMQTELAEAPSAKNAEILGDQSDRKSPILIAMDADATESEQAGLIERARGLSQLGRDVVIAADMDRLPADVVTALNALQTASVFNANAAFTDQGLSLSQLDAYLKQNSLYKGNGTINLMVRSGLVINTDNLDPRSALANAIVLLLNSKSFAVAVSVGHLSNMTEVARLVAKQA